MLGPDTESLIDQGRELAYASRRDIDFFAQTLRLAASSGLVEALMTSQIERKYPYDGIATEGRIIRKDSAKRWRIVVLRDAEEELDTVGMVFSDGKGIRYVGAFVPSTNSLIVEIKGDAFDESFRLVDTGSPELSGVKSALDRIRNRALLKK